MRNIIILFFIVLILTLTYSCKAQNKHERQVYYESDKSGQSQTDSQDINSSLNGNRHNAITRAVQIAENAIVGINVTGTRQVVYRDPFDDPFFRYFFGERRSRGRVREYEVQGLGSGFLISPDGYILTNHHVAGNASKIVVTMTNGEKYDAEIVGSDITSAVALLKINGKKLPFLKLGNSDDIIVGEWAIAFGNPFGLFDLNAKPTVTVGVISNKGVNFTQEGRVYKGMLQTDAAISSGNSGGPLVNALGEVIGMNTVIFSTAQSGRGAGSIGIGWAIPINRVKNIVDIIKKDKKVNRNFDIGIEVSELDDYLASYLGIEKRDGVVVVAVNTKLPAGRAGIEPGDIIIEINDKKIATESDYQIQINDSMVGNDISFTFLRDGNKMTTVFKIPEKGLQRDRK